MSATLTDPSDTLRPLTEEEYAQLPTLSDERIEELLEQGRRVADAFERSRGSGYIPHPGLFYR